MYVKDIMNQPVITCSSDSDLNVAAHLMWEHDCGTIPVVDQEGRLAGMVTDRDICMAAYTQGLPLRAIPVTSAMTQYALACHLDDSVNTAEELMREGQIRRVPVLNREKRLVGIVSLGDIAISSNPAFSGMALRDVSEPRDPTARQRRLAERSEPATMPSVSGATRRPAAEKASGGSATRRRATSAGKSKRSSSGTTRRKSVKGAARKSSSRSGTRKSAGRAAR